LITQRKRK